MLSTNAILIDTNPNSDANDTTSLPPFEYSSNISSKYATFSPFDPNSLFVPNLIPLDVVIIYICSILVYYILTLYSVFRLQSPLRSAKYVCITHM